LGASLAQAHAHFFLWLWLLFWALANPSCMPNLKFLASAIAQMLKGNHKILGSSYSTGPRPLFFGFYDGFWQTPSSMPNLKLLASAIAEIS